MRFSLCPLSQNISPCGSIYFLEQRVCLTIESVLSELSLSNDGKDKALEHEQTKLFIIKHYFILYKNQEFAHCYENGS